MTSDLFSTFQLPTLNFPNASPLDSNMHSDTTYTPVRIYDPTLITPLDYLKQLAKQFSMDSVDDAFYVCNLSDVVLQMYRWKTLLPRVHPFYAVKCNDDPVLLRTLAELGASFDCASKGEIKRVMSLGVAPERIIYANPCKQLSMIRYAREVGVAMMTFDNLDELKKIRSVYPEAKLVLRIVPPAVQVQCVLGNKFGATEDHAANLIRAAKVLGLDVVGISFHVGSGCKEARGYSLAVEAARRIWDTMLFEGFSPFFLDVGGGFPGAPAPSNPGSAHQDPADVAKSASGPSLGFDEVAVCLAQALEKYFPPEQGVTIVGEPGRYFASRAYTLCANIIARRVCYNGNNQSEDENDIAPPAPAQSSCGGSSGSGGVEYMYYCNDGVYASFNCLLYDHAIIEPHFLLQTQENASTNERHLSNLYGPTCDGLDILVRSYPMPLLHIGDWLYFEAMGAYSLASSSEFNGMPRAKVHYLLEANHFSVFESLLAKDKVTAMILDRDSINNLNNLNNLGNMESSLEAMVNQSMSMNNILVSSSSIEDHCNAAMDNNNCELQQNASSMSASTSDFSISSLVATGPTITFSGGHRQGSDDSAEYYDCTGGDCLTMRVSESDSNNDMLDSALVLDGSSVSSSSSQLLAAELGGFSSALGLALEAIPGDGIGVPEATGAEAMVEFQLVELPMAN